MKKTLITLAALATSTAFADWTWQGGNTITTDLWNTTTNWTGTGDNSGNPTKGPGTAGSNIWNPIVVSNASGTVTGMEGWELDLTLNNAHLTMTSKKLQNPTKLTLDGTSSLTLNVTEGNCQGTKTISTAGFLTINVNATVGSNNKGTWNATLIDGGSLSFGGSSTSSIGSLTLNLSGSNLFSGYSAIGNAYELVTVTVVSITGGTSFSSVDLTEGSTLGGFEMELSNEDLTASADNLGKYTISQGDGGISITYVTATPEPTTATLSLLALAGLCARRRRK